MPHYRIKEGKEYTIISIAIGKAFDKILYSFILLKSKKKDSNLEIEYKVINVMKGVCSKLTQMLHLRVKL